ncbi:hypothetical protein [Cellulophaga tyrosinoxydans]|uniref:Uncharacterized protein n=1 Tax=Cellulophaga tyrosinoxydans TaxID=504486 RepID=A0A1W2CPR0_9FLAO|nr:hypothetical protein [Cellulophaga tyrosinoxydans]SMC87245.1 hypothetical protein SAMN05660703_3153 [Cellulophaga tyrosinoxydans]
MKTFLILISFLFLSNSNVIHQDRILEIDKNGNLIGLPKEFSPAKFDLNEKKLRINDKEIVFPKCLNYYFEEHQNPKLSFLASWYHSKKIMPYYLIINIHDNDVNYGYKILVDLETLDLIYINKFIREGNTTYNPKVELTEECLTEYKSGIKTRN